MTLIFGDAMFQKELKLSGVKTLEAYFAPKIMKEFYRRGIKDWQLQIYVLDLVKRRAVNSEEHAEIEEDSIVKFMYEIENDDLYAQLRKYKLVGEHCFMTASFRDGQLNRYFKSIDFCISMGAHAYMELGSLFRERQKKEAVLYAKLGSEGTFKTLVDALRDAMHDLDDDISMKIITPRTSD